jgi:CTP:phosphocholine cytidylyltransferase involved in choline phosphorylation for cell surface LPS epitopes
MNLVEADLLLALNRQHIESQRALSEITGHSLGAVNQALSSLGEGGYLDGFSLLPRVRKKIQACRPQNAILLAAGYGMRMIPIQQERPKALLCVRGERLIERQIRQLQEVGIRNITIVVGFMKEKFDYLIDLFGVKLVVNPLYYRKNNLASLALVRDQIANTYVLPCDLYCAQNPFSTSELYSWYLMSDLPDAESGVRINRKKEIVKTARGEGLSMVGISYLCGEDADRVRANLAAYDRNPRFDDCFWEEALYEKNKMFVKARQVSAGDVIEINTFEELRAVDDTSSHLHSDALSLIASCLHCKEAELSEIQVLKKGMTNRSFSFTCRGDKYIMRIPGEGTDSLINRRQEAAVYKAIQGHDLCDSPLYLNPDNGYKITRYLTNSRTGDANNETDLIRMVDKLRDFHSLRLEVAHSFPLFDQIQRYEDLRENTPSAYSDYLTTKRAVFSLKEYIDAQEKSFCLTHIDAVPDNFLFVEKEGDTQVQLLDWEYAGMQDPHVDLAMFSIYALYQKDQIDHLLDLYFNHSCSIQTRIKIYCYVSICGLLWSNWCEYKNLLGVEFGQYSLCQYRYAKEYASLAKTMMEANGCTP